MLTNRTTRKADLNPFREVTAEEQQRNERQAKIDAEVDRRFKELKRDQSGTPRGERASEDELRKRARREVANAIRREHLNENIRKASADVASAYHRNLHLFGPWYAGAGYAAAGELSYALAATGTVPSTGAELVAASGAAVTTVLSWRKIKQLPEKYWNKMYTGLAAGCVTCASLPLSPLDWHPLALLGGLGGLIYASANYWRDKAASYPPPGGNQSTMDEAVEQVATPESGVSAEAADVIADWNEFVYPKILKGAELVKPRPFDHGWIFTVQLTRGEHKYEDLRSKATDIAFALNVATDDITTDPGKSSVLEPTLTVVTQRPDTAYTGPIIHSDGGTISIELGPYVDGNGVETFKVFGDQLSEADLATGKPHIGSMYGGFVLGTKGSGKSATVEEVAIGLRELGVEIWYLDGKDGQSSPALMEMADWPLRGLHSPDGRNNGNVSDLLDAVKNVVDVRNLEGGVAGHRGFQHTPDRPGIMVIVDECHRVFGALNPETDNAFGEDFGEEDRRMRSAGVGIFGASQLPTLPTFGGSNALRSGMCDTNGLLLRYAGNNASIAFPEYEGQPAGGLPPNRGYGYSPAGDRAHTAWQARWAPDLDRYLRELAKATLDQRSAQAAGEAYRRRFETAQQSLEEMQNRLAAFDNGTPLPKPKKSPSKESSGGDVLTFPGQYTAPGNAAGETTLTERQQQILALLHEGAKNAKALSAELDVTPRTVNTDLRKLRESKHIRVLDEKEGIYAVSTDL